MSDRPKSPGMESTAPVVAHQEIDPLDPRRLERLEKQGRDLMQQGWDDAWAQGVKHALRRSSYYKSDVLSELDFLFRNFQPSFVSPYLERMKQGIEELRKDPEENVTCSSAIAELMLTLHRVNLRVEDAFQQTVNQTDLEADVFEKLLERELYHEVAWETYKQLFPGPEKLSDWLRRHEKRNVSHTHKNEVERWRCAKCRPMQESQERFTSIHRHFILADRMATLTQGREPEKRQKEGQKFVQTFLEQGKSDGGYCYLMLKRFMREYGIEAFFKDKLHEPLKERMEKVSWDNTHYALESLVDQLILLEQFEEASTLIHCCASEGMTSGWSVRAASALVVATTELQHNTPKSPPTDYRASVLAAYGPRTPEYWKDIREWLYRSSLEKITEEKLLSQHMMEHERRIAEEYVKISCALSHKGAGLEFLEKAEAAFASLTAPDRAFPRDGRLESLCADIQVARAIHAPDRVSFDFIDHPTQAPGGALLFHHVAYAGIPVKRMEAGIRLTQNVGALKGWG